MNGSPRPVAEEELHAWVDGRLDAARRAEIDAWLAERPIEAQKLNGWRRQNQWLHAAFDPVLEEPIPARLTERVRHRPRLPWLAMAASAAWLALGVLIGYGLRPEAVEPVAELEVPAHAWVQRAVMAYRVYSPEVRHPVEVAADQEAHLVAWLSKRLGTPLRAPALGERGWDLVGGRLLPGESGPAAQFMYQDAAGRRLTLYLRARGDEPADTAFRYAEADAVASFFWIDGPLGYAVSAQMPKAELLALAEGIYQQLNTPHAAEAPR